MSFIFSLSSTNVGSDSKRLPEMFKWRARAIEVSNMASHEDLSYLIDTAHQNGVDIGLKTPLFRTDDSKGLLWDSETAWYELERNLHVASRNKFSYVQVRFPYFCDSKGHSIGFDRIRDSVARLSDLQQRYGVKIVCNPKLGPHLNSTSLLVLWAISEQELSRWNLSFCLDFGDIYLAFQHRPCMCKELVSHLSPWCSVVHLHHVWKGGTRYYWTPVSAQGNVPIKEMLGCLDSENRDIYAVLELSPHRTGDPSKVAEGITWLFKNTGPWKTLDATFNEGCHVNHRGPK